MFHCRSRFNQTLLQVFNRYQILQDSDWYLGHKLRSGHPQFWWDSVIWISPLSCVTELKISLAAKTSLSSSLHPFVLGINKNWRRSGTVSFTLLCPSSWWFQSREIREWREWERVWRDDGRRSGWFHPSYELWPTKEAGSPWHGRLKIVSSGARCRTVLIMQKKTETTDTRAGLKPTERFEPFTDLLLIRTWLWRLSLIQVTLRQGSSTSFMLVRNVSLFIRKFRQIPNFTLSCFLSPLTYEQNRQMTDWFKSKFDLLLYLWMSCSTIYYMKYGRVTEELWI